MTNAQMLALVVGTLLPNIVAIVQQPTWPTWGRSLVAFVICLIVGFLTALTGGILTSADLLTNGLIVCVAALSTYEAFWKNIGITAAIETFTSKKVVQGTVIASAPAPVTVAPVAAVDAAPVTPADPAAPVTPAEGQ